jgi:protein-tyrosine-phosphatase
MPTKILFVCLGNICRSPLAEAIFKRQLEEKGLSDRFLADSCGTADLHIGERPDARTIRNARQHGVEIHHVGRQLVVSDFAKFDLILTMDRANLRHTLDMASAANLKSSHVKMIRSYDPESLGAQDVPDPWYGSGQGFEDAFQMLWRTCAALISTLENQTLPAENQPISNPNSL